jgi:hypothetical protein
MLAKVGRAVARWQPSGGSIRYVSVFKRLPRSHMHVRTPIMIGVILMLVVVLSAFCYYQVG